MDQFPPRDPPAPPPPPPVPPLPTPQLQEAPAVPWRALEGIPILIFSLLTGIFFTMLAAVTIEDRDTLQLVATIIIEASLAGWVVLWLRLRHGVGARALGLRFSAEDVWTGLIGGLVGFAVAGAAGSILESIYRAITDKALEAPEQLPKSLPGGRVALAILAVTVVAPIAEEFFFRGFLYQALRKWKGVTGAMLLSAFFFSLAHGHPVLILAIFPLGIVLAYLYERRGSSLTAAIAAHALFNSIGVIFLLR